MTITHARTSALEGPLPAFVRATVDLWTRKSKHSGRGRTGTFLTKQRILDLLAVQGGVGSSGLSGDETHLKIESLLGDYDRYFSINAGNIANLSKRDQTARKLLTAINALTSECLTQASVALQGAQCVYAGVESYASEYVDDDHDHLTDASHYLRHQDPTKPVRVPQAYWSEHDEGDHLEGGFEDLDQFLCATSHFNPSYLQWIELLREKPLAIQEQATKWLQEESRLEVDAETFDLECRFNSPDDDIEEVLTSQHADKLNDARKKHKVQRPEGIAFLESSRVHLKKAMGRLPWMPYSAGHHVIEPSVQFGWPFPRVFRGDENAVEVYRAHLAYEALGEWMSQAGRGLKLTANDNNADLEVRVDNFNRDFLASMGQVMRAGVLLKSIAKLLQVLSAPSKEVGRCALCYRRVGKGKHKYCKVHGEHDTYKVTDQAPDESKSSPISHRTRLRQSQKIAVTYIDKTNSLLLFLENFEFFKDPERVLGQMLRDTERHSPFGPLAECDVALKKHRKFLELLRPIAGEVVFLELEARSKPLLDNVELRRKELSDALDGYDAINNAIQKKSDELFAQWLASARVSLLSKIDECNDVSRQDPELLEARKQCVRRVAMLKTELQRACSYITVVGFLSDFFSRQNCYFNKPDDVDHPMYLSPGSTVRRMQTNTFNLSEIVRDDLRALRAWKEIGGDRFDELMAQRHGLEIAHARKRFSIDDVRTCVETLSKGKACGYQPSYQEVADELHATFQVRVTHTAIFQKVYRSGDAALKARFVRRT